jgi:hypothetical protein
MSEVIVSRNTVGPVLPALIAGPRVESIIAGLREIRLRNESDELSGRISETGRVGSHGTSALNNEFRVVEPQRLVVPSNHCHPANQTGVASPHDPNCAQSENDTPMPKIANDNAN